MRKIVDTNKIFADQNAAYEDRVLLGDIVPANGQKVGSAFISTLGHFKCYQVAGHFETQKSITLTDTSTVIIDDGMNHLRGQLEDSCGNRKLMSDYIPLNLWLSPGRVIRVRQTPANAFVEQLDSGVNPLVMARRAAPSNSLFYCIPFKYTFSANSNIIFTVINDSNVALAYELMFYGLRIR